MSTDALHSFRFKTTQQWDACLFVEADRGQTRDEPGLRPFRTFALPPDHYPSGDSCAPVITRTGEVMWCERKGVIHRLPAGDELARKAPAPFPTGEMSRLVSTSRGLWVIGPPPATLQVYEDDSLTRLLTVNLRELQPVDIAAAGRCGVWVLAKRDDAWQAFPVDTAGHLGQAVMLDGLAAPVAFVYLSRPQRFVVLTKERHPRLRWFDLKGRALLSLPVGAMHPCFRAYVLGSDGRSRLFVGGADVDQLGERFYVLVYDADGNRLGEVPIESAGALTGIDGGRDTLLITDTQGLRRFTASDVVVERSEPVRCRLLTPSLFSPDREDQRRWLRVEALATLPEGATLELMVGATDDAGIRDRLDQIAKDESLPVSLRVRRILEEPNLWRAPTVFLGTDVDAEPTSYSAPLFDVRDRYLWLCVTLIAMPGARLPVVSELAVRYPGRSLMEDLPAIYRRGEGEPGNFLRSLVGVLETTTQSLDDRIGSMGSLVHPATAAGPWLDFVARWLGLPWDDGMSEEQKKAIVRRSPELARSRGTRAGLETLLEALMPGTPRRFRVSDTTADFGFAMVGNDASRGSRLPGMIGGRAPWNAELDVGARLGSMRLPCPGQTDDGTWRLTGRIRVDVAATGEERQAWEPWLLAVLSDMVPITTRIQLHWISAQSLRSNRLGDTLTLDPAPSPHLGTDAVTGLARMPERGTRLSASGPEIGSRLG